eukprot:c23294_g2_i2 orf=270-1436(-)
MNIYPFNMKKVDMVVALLHITSLVFVTTVDAHTVSTHVAPSHLNESLLRATGANYIEHNATHLSLYSPPLRYGSSAYDHVWPALEFNWRVVVGSIIAFIGGSLGCAGGIGGGGIFVPMLVLIIGFDEKSSTALSKCMIMGASAASVLFNFGLKSSLIDYDLALVFQPMLMLGISIGVIFNVIFPNWIVTILLLVLFTGTALTTFIRAVSLYKKETIEKLLDKEERSANCQVSSETDLENTECIDLEPFDAQNSNSMKRHWKSFVALGYVWISFLVLQIVKNYTTSCSSYYWLWNILQVPVAASVFFTKSIQLFIGNKKNNDREVEESLIPAPTQFKWTFPIICVCAAAGLLAGTVGGLLGLGGGFIIGPLFLELGFTPELFICLPSMQ